MAYLSGVIDYCGIDDKDIDKGILIPHESKTRTISIGEHKIIEASEKCCNGIELRINLTPRITNGRVLSGTP